MQNAMPQVTFIPEGPAVSQLIAGVCRMADWQMTAAARHTRISACLQQGINSFDHADIYGNQTCESLFGEALSIEPSLRDQLLLISKCGILRAGQALDSPTAPVRTKHYDTSRGHIACGAPGKRNHGPTWQGAMVPDLPCECGRRCCLIRSWRQSARDSRIGNVVGNARDSNCISGSTAITVGKLHGQFRAGTT